LALAQFGSRRRAAPINCKLVGFGDRWKQQHRAAVAHLFRQIGAKVCTPKNMALAEGRINQVTDAALTVGFSDLSHFSDAFKIASSYFRLCGVDEGISEADFDRID
jgi:AraC-like DNA-binding protein